MMILQFLYKIIRENWVLVLEALAGCLFAIRQQKKGGRNKTVMIDKLYLEKTIEGN